MAGFDLAAQRRGTIPGFGRIEGGYIDFSAGSQTLDVPTGLTTCFLGFGIADTTQSGGGGGNYALVATSDCDVSSGKITFTRENEQYDYDARFRYIVVGW